MPDIWDEINAIKQCLNALDTNELPELFIMGDPTELTIASGAITRILPYHTVDTEGDAGSDDLATVNGGITGAILVLQSVNNGRVVTCKDGTGNLQLSADMVLNNTQDTLTLIYNGSNWCELSRSDNGAAI